LHKASYLQRYSISKSTLLEVSEANDTADHKSDP
jgi:hypothetical protein